MSSPDLVEEYRRLAVDLDLDRALYNFVLVRDELDPLTGEHAMACENIAGILKLIAKRDALRAQIFEQ